MGPLLRAGLSSTTTSALLFSVKLSMTHSSKPQTDFFLHIIATMFSDKSIQTYGELRQVLVKRMGSLTSPGFELWEKILTSLLYPYHSSQSQFPSLKKVQNMMKTRTRE